MLKFVKSIYYFALTFIIPIILVLMGFVLVRETKISETKLVDSEFLITTLGVILGFGFTLVAFIASMIDKMKEHIHKNQKDEIKQKKQTIIITNLVRELNQDVMFMFFSLLFIVLIMIIDKIEINRYIPQIINIKNGYLYKRYFINSLNLATFFLNLYALYDLISTTFKVSKATDNILYDKPLQ